MVLIIIKILSFEKNMIKKNKEIYKKNFLNLFKIYKILIQKNNDVSFEGWGMTTLSTNNPWEKNLNDTVKIFNKTHFKILNDIKKKKFTETTPGNDISDSIETLEGLKLRHYLIFNSVKLLKNKKLKKTFVECGVGDGLSIKYVLNQTSPQKSEFYLYDSWQQMIKKYLITDVENSKIGSYNSLSFETTKKNLKNYPHKITFNKGYIPDIFNENNNPKKISWLHIDLNSSMPTLKSLEFFYDKIESNGIIIFDDYGWKGYEDTRYIVDKFLNKKNENFFQFPTGQGIYIKE